MALWVAHRMMHAVTGRIMKRCGLTFLLTVIAALPPAIVRADVIGTATLRTANMAGKTSSTDYPTLDYVNFSFYFGGDGLGNSQTKTLATVRWSPANVGETLSIDSTDPDFAPTVALLSNATNDKMGFGYTFPQSTGGAATAANESSFFGGSPGFPGTQITSIDFHLQSFSWAHSTVNSAGTTIYITGPNAVITETINAVPEPASLATLTLLAPLILRRRRDKKLADYMMAGRAVRDALRDRRIGLCGDRHPQCKRRRLTPPAAADHWTARSMNEE